MAEFPGTSRSSMGGTSSQVMCSQQGTGLTSSPWLCQRLRFQWENQDLVNKREKQGLVKFSEPHLSLCESKVGAVLCFRAEVQMNSTSTCNYILSNWIVSAAETWALFQKNKKAPKIKSRLPKDVNSKGCQRHSPFSPGSPLCPSHPGAALTLSPILFFIYFSCPALLEQGQGRLRCAGTGISPFGSSPRAELLAGNLQPEQLETDPTKSSFCICKVDLKGQPCLLSCLSHSHEQQYHQIQSELKMLIIF